MSLPTGPAGSTGPAENPTPYSPQRYAQELQQYALLSSMAFMNTTKVPEGSFAHKFFALEGLLFQVNINAFPPEMLLNDLKNLVEEAQTGDIVNKEKRREFFNKNKSRLVKTAEQFFEYYQKMYEGGNVFSAMVALELLLQRRFPELMGDTQKIQGGNYVLNRILQYISERFAAKMATLTGDEKKLHQALMSLGYHMDGKREQVEQEGVELAQFDLVMYLFKRFKVGSLLTDSTTAFTARNKFQPGQDLEFGAPKLTQNSWRAIGDHYAEMLRTEKNVEVVPAVLPLTIGKQNLMGVVSPSVEFLENTEVVFHILDPEIFQQMIKQLGFEGMKPRAADDGEERVDMPLTEYSILLRINPDGDVTMSSGFPQPVRQILGDTNYLILRAHLLHNLAALTVAKYRFLPLAEAIQKTLGKVKDPRKPSTIDMKKFPRERQIEIELGDEEDSSGEEIEPETATRKLSSHSAPVHKRLLPENFFPSLEQYTLCFGRMVLYAFVIDPNKREVVRKEQVNYVKGYDQFLEIAGGFKSAEEAKGYIVRFETRVKEHHVEYTPAAVSREVRANIEVLDPANFPSEVVEQKE